MANPTENKIYQPSQEVIDQANVKEYDQLYQYSIKNREAFLGRTSRATFLV